MTIPAKRIAIFGALISLQACTSLTLQSNDAQITQLSEQHRYVTALAALDAHKQSIPDYEQKHAAILDEADRYQSTLLSQAGTLIRQQEYARAKILIDDNRAELPPSPALDQFDAQLNAASARYLQRSLDDLIQLRATSLAKEHSAYETLAKGAISADEKNAVARHQADVDYFVPLLTAAGARAMTRNDGVKAAQYFAIANQLKPSPELAQQLKIAEKSISKTKQKQQTARTGEREQQYRELYSNFDTALREQRFSAAREALAQANTLGIHRDELETAQRNYDNAIANFIAAKVDAGNHHYADGRIEEALQEWRSANTLMPTPDLQEKIARAQKFIERLNTLQNAQN